MTAEKLQELIDQGEGTELEFKSSSIALNRDAFEPVCGFLNRKGGHPILGVQDNGKITGAQEDKIQGIVNQIMVNANNPQKLNPPYYLSTEIVEINNKKVIAVYIPESSQVHSTAGKIFDRNQDGDLNITQQQAAVSQLHLSKQDSYTENRVFPYLRLTDFEPNLFDKVRALVRNQQPNHPWLSLNNDELLRSAGLHKRNMLTGEEVYTLAAVLLLGTDEAIQSVLPHHRIDAIKRVDNKERYDDRDDIRTNLIDSYQHLNAFIAKHLPDKFQLIDGQRINVRDHLFREIIGNLLVHQEYTNAFPSKLIIETTQVTTENWNKPRGTGTIDPANFSPFPKNPLIAKFFREIGWVDELGSGVRNTYKYTAFYTPGSTPLFSEDDVFKIVIPLEESSEESSEETGEETGEETREETREEIKKLLSENPNLTVKNIAFQIGLSRQGVEYHIANLKKEGKLKRIGSTKSGHWQIIDE